MTVQLVWVAIIIAFVAVVLRIARTMTDNVAARRSPVHQSVTSATVLPPPVTQHEYPDSIPPRRVITLGRVIGTAPVKGHRAATSVPIGGHRLGQVH